MAPKPDRSGHCGLRRNYLIFRDLQTRALDLLSANRYHSSADYAQLAAAYAWHNHTGLFASPSLEDILLTIGKETIPADASFGTAASPGRSVKHVLHVLTRTYHPGGHTRLAMKWIQSDSDRTHSLVLTRQPAHTAYRPLEDAARSAGGRTYLLDSARHGLIARARMLRDIAGSADQVILHIHPDDVVPILAFADGQNLPPITFMNHADHVFWLGVGISNMVAHFRDSGLLLSQERRGIEGARCAVLPIPLHWQGPTVTRSEAKRRLGLRKEDIVLLSVALPYKYAPINAYRFANVHVPILMKHDNAVLLVIGPSHGGMWTKAAHRTGGRVKALGRRDDVASFYEAADIYVDSFPFASLTSLLEAGCYGLPLVSFAAVGRESRVLCGDDPALPGEVVQTTAAQYAARLSRLIEDGPLRLRLGDRLRESIADTHAGEGWKEYVERLYRCAEAAPPAPAAQREEEALQGELDATLWTLHSKGRMSYPLVSAIQACGRPLPLWLRVWVWGRIIRATELAVRVQELLSVRGEAWLLTSFVRRFRRAKRAYEAHQP